MRVAFDYQAFCRRPYTGISRYYTQLVEQLTLLGQLKPKIFAPYHVNRILAQSPLAGSAGVHIRTHPRVARPLIREISHVIARSRMRRWRPHIVHETYFSSHGTAPRGVPTVLTVFDLIHERFSKQFPAYDRTRSAKRAAIARADQIICISSATADDLQTFYAVSCRKISVIHLGITALSSECVTQVPVQQSPLGQRPFLLYVGERGGYKNFAALARAYAESPRLCHEVGLICCGGGAFSKRERALLYALGMLDHVRQVQATDRTLVQLYSHATALVYPSLCEGFGLPLLEAMAHGCPVLASRVPAHREVADNAAAYFDPTEPASLRDALETLVSSEALRRRLRQLGLERARLFSWQRCAEETQTVYSRLVAH